MPGAAWAHFFISFAGDSPGKRGTAPWSGLDPSQRLRNGPGMLLERFSAQTVDSGSISDHFSCFWPDLKIRCGPKLGPEPPKLGLEAPTRPADSGTFFWAPFRNFFLYVFRRISMKCDEKSTEQSSGMGPRKKLRNLQAWLWLPGRALEVPGQALVHT